MEKKYLSGYLLLLLFSCGVFMFRLGSGSLADFDESITAIRVREMALSGDYLTVHDNYSPSFRKPPLYYWLSQPMIRLFGAREFSMRIVSALAGVLAVLVSAAVARTVCRSDFGILAGYVLATNWRFVGQSRLALPDSSMILFGLLALYSCLRYVSAERAKGWLVAAFIWAALATLTKGTGAFAGTIPVVGVACLLGSSTQGMSIRAFLVGLALFLVLVLPWHLHQFLTHGDVFLLEYFGRDYVSSMPVCVGGSITSVYGKGILNCGPALLFLAAVGLCVSLRQARRTAPAHLLTLSATTTLVLVFILYRTRRDEYLMPLMPLLAVFSVYAASQLVSASSMHWRKALLLLAIVHVALFARQASRSFIADGSPSGKELGGTANSLFRGESGVLLAHNVQIPSLAFYSQIRTMRTDELSRVRDVANEHDCLPIVIRCKDEELFQSAFPKASLVRSREPCSLWVLRRNRSPRQTGRLPQSSNL